MSRHRHHSRRNQGGTSPITTPRTGSGLAQFWASEVAQFSLSPDSLRVGGVVRGLVQPPAPSQRHQVRDAPAAPQRPCRRNLPSTRPCLRKSPAETSASMEPIHPLLAPARGGVDQQATRRTDDGSGSTITKGRLNCSLGVTPFLKVTALTNLFFARRQLTAAILATQLYAWPFFWPSIVTMSALN